MGRNTKIDWCDDSWNPVTGCKHGCEYCYARGIARRYEGYDAPGGTGTTTKCPLKRAELSEPLTVTWSDGRTRKAPYPFGFMPTLHKYRLDIPAKWSEPRTIFVCSMADLFGDWVPDEWIAQVFNACLAAPQHRYLFLTKAPERYKELALDGKLLTRKNFWYGTSTPMVGDAAFWSRPSDEGKPYYQTFLSIEPILERFGKGGRFGSVAMTNWVIVGAETGNRKGKVIPEKGWIMELAEECDRRGKPIFMKDSLREIMGSDFRQEFPWGGEQDGR